MRRAAHAVVQTLRARHLARAERQLHAICDTLQLRPPVTAKLGTCLPLTAFRIRPFHIDGTWDEKAGIDFMVPDVQKLTRIPPRTTLGSLQDNGVPKVGPEIGLYRFAIP